VVKFPTGSILLTLVILTASGFGSLFLRSHAGDQDALSFVSGFQIITTFITGFWYYVRIVGTERRGGVSSSIVGVFFSAVIAITFIICFFVAGTLWWFILTATVLALAIGKDIEAIIGQRRSVGGGELEHRWRRYMTTHHWYSVIRDLSMSFWWLLAAFFTYGFQTPIKATFFLFAVPYVVLVIGWILLTESTYKKEDTLLELDDQARGKNADK